MRLLVTEEVMDENKATDDKAFQDDVAIDLLEQLLIEAEQRLSLVTSNEYVEEAGDSYYTGGVFTTVQGRSDGAGRIANNEYSTESPRRYHIWPVFITALAVFVLLTGGLTIFNRTVLASQADERAEIKRQGDELLDEAIAFIQEADTVVVALDVASVSQLGEEDIPKLEALLDQLDSAQESLDKAIDKAFQAMGTYTNRADMILAQHAVDAAEYRKMMLDLSRQITDYDIKVIKSGLMLERAWSLIIEAHLDMRTAAEMVPTHGAQGVSISRDYNERALYRLSAAWEILEDIPNIFPEIDLSCLTDYLAVKIESAQLALDSDNLYLNGYYTRSKEKNEEFKVKDAEVVELILRIPPVPFLLVLSAYDEATWELRENYKKNRSEAADADAHLRAYLGISKN